jgi:hypothetical protein
VDYDTPTLITTTAIIAVDIEDVDVTKFDVSLRANNITDSIDNNCSMFYTLDRLVKVAVLKCLLPEGVYDITLDYENISECADFEWELL